MSWNRNTIYEHLRDKDLKPLFHRKGRGYHVEFQCQPHQKECDVIFNWGYIRGVESIYLCTNECVIVSKFQEMKINIYYRCIKDFEVRVYEEQ